MTTPTHITRSKGSVLVRFWEGEPFYHESSGKFVGQTNRADITQLGSIPANTLDNLFGGEFLPEGKIAKIKYRGIGHDKIGAVSVFAFEIIKP